MQTFPDISLKPYNTFGIDVKARQFVSVSSVEQLKEVLEEHRLENKFVIGGGSNMLLTKDIEALVIHLAIKGKEVIREDENHVLVEIQGGESWHDFVLWAIAHDFGGIENMSLIPGNVGTSPIQNIGAYGAEIKDTFVSCDAVNIETQQMRTFMKDECEFGYRESIFKNAEKDKYIITSVVFRLTRHFHKINTGYGDITKLLVERSIENPTIKDVSDAVITIRQSKLPDPKEIGNSGSFFKNPVVAKSLYDQAKLRFPDMPHYIVSDDEVKIPAGWLIEQAGLKGYRDGDAGVHKNQALVLVNYGNASGQQILDLAKKVQNTVFEKFGIPIETEVNVV